MDRIQEIVQQAIELADLVRAHEPARVETVLNGLAKLAAELRDNVADHPARQRLENYISSFRQ